MNVLVECGAKLSKHEDDEKINYRERERGILFSYEEKQNKQSCIFL